MANQTALKTEFRIFQATARTKQLDVMGRRAEAGKFFVEPTDYEGDVLWSRGFDSERTARQYLEQIVLDENGNPV